MFIMMLMPMLMRMMKLCSVNSEKRLAQLISDDDPDRS